MIALLAEAAPAALSIIVRATLLLALAWTAAALLRFAGKSAATRHVAWLFGMCALLALPLLWLLTPSVSVPVLPAAVDGPVATLAPQSAAMPGAAEALIAVYLLGVFVLLVRLHLGRRLLARAWRDAMPAADADVLRELAGAARDLRVSVPVELRIADGATMPMTWGTRSPKILLPAESLSWDRARLRLVLAHELAHVARRDAVGLAAASLACALYWFHPGVWHAARQLRLEQEYAADDRVLVAGAPARGYALGLLDLARRLGSAARPDHAATMATACQLERRVLAITSFPSRERPGSVFLTGSALVASLLLLAVAAGVPVSLPRAPSLSVSSIVAPFVTAPPVGARSTTGQSRDGFAATPPATGSARDLANDARSPALVRPPVDAAAPVSARAVAEPLAPPSVAAADQPAADGSTSKPQPSVYGPTLSRPVAGQTAADPRIPSMLRSDPDGSPPAGSSVRLSAVSRSPQGGPRMMVNLTSTVPIGK